MLKIDGDLLVRVGLHPLRADIANLALKSIYEILEGRVGVRLASAMTDGQLDEFEAFFRAKDDAGAFSWLEANFPNYSDTVQEAFDELEEELTAEAARVREAVDRMLLEVAERASR
jgi:Protein of unknown function (DUF5663)